MSKYLSYLFTSFLSIPSILSIISFFYTSSTSATSYSTNYPCQPRCRHAYSNPHSSLLIPASSSPQLLTLHITYTPITPPPPNSTLSPPHNRSYPTLFPLPLLNQIQRYYCMYTIHLHSMPPILHTPYIQTHLTSLYLASAPKNPHVPHQTTSPINIPIPNITTTSSPPQPLAIRRNFLCLHSTRSMLHADLTGPTA